MTANPILMIRFEPTSYTLACSQALKDFWPSEVEIVYLHPALTQKWSLDADQTFSFLPKGRVASIVSLFKHIRATRPCLLHVPGWNDPSVFAAILIARFHGLPVVVDLDTWRGTPSIWRGWVKRLLYPHLFELVTHFGAGGSRQADYLRSFCVPVQKITLIHMTVDVAGIRKFLDSHPAAGRDFRIQFGLAREAPLALFIGRLVSLKGIEDLLAAWPHVISQAPDMQLVIAGDGPLRTRVDDAAAADPSIRVVGRLAGDDVWRAYAAADFVVAPSHFEPWGLIVNEAMAAGVPILATDIFGCLGDLLRDNETALVIPAETPECLSLSMLRLAADPDLRHRLANAASALISDWTVERQAERVAGIWESALGGRRDTD